MQNFVARLQFRIIVGDMQSHAQYEELTVWVKAADRQDAYTKAHAIGRQNEDELLNTGRNRVCWQFEGIALLDAVGEPENGMVLFSELKDDHTPGQLQVIQQRIHRINENCNSALTNDPKVWNRKSSDEACEANKSGVYS